MRFELTPRPHVSSAMRALAPVAAFITAFLIAGFVIWLMGRSPIAAFDVYVLQPLSDPWSLQELVVKATPLALIAIGLSYCFRANLWNIGAEGQYVIGAVLGSWLALKTHGTEAGFWVLPLMLLLGVIGGALYGLIPAFLFAEFLADLVSVERVLRCLLEENRDGHLAPAPKTTRPRQKRS